MTTPRRDAHVVEVQPGERLDRDFILRWRIDGARAAQLARVRATTPTARPARSCSRSCRRARSRVAAKPRDVVFVIDRSGSMGGWKMVAARRAAARMIDTLTSRDRFSVIAFDDVVDVAARARGWSTRPIATAFAPSSFSPRSRRAAAPRWPSRCRRAAQHARRRSRRSRARDRARHRRPGRQRGPDPARARAAACATCAMFTLGIDQAVNAAFLRRLAGAGGGLCELVESEDRLDEVMAKVHRRIGTPVATELRLAATGLDVDAAHRRAARSCPTSTPARRSSIARSLHGHAPPAMRRSTIDGTSLGDPLQPARSRAHAVARAGAVARARAGRARTIRDLEDQYAAGGAASSSSEIVARVEAVQRAVAVHRVPRGRSQRGRQQGRPARAGRCSPSRQPAGWEQQRADAHRLAQDPCGR